MTALSKFSLFYLAAISIAFIANADDSATSQPSETLKLPSLSRRRQALEIPDESSQPLTRHSRAASTEKDDARRNLFRSLPPSSAVSGRRVRSGLKSKADRRTGRKRKNRPRKSKRKRKRGKGKKRKGKGKGKKRNKKNKKKTKKKRRKSKPGSRSRRRQGRRRVLARTGTDSENQLRKNLRQYVWDVPKQDTLEAQKQRRLANKYWARRARAVHDKTKMDGDYYEKEYEEPLPGDTDIDQYQPGSSKARTVIRATTSLERDDEPWDAYPDVNCLAWDPVTGRCISDVKSGCFGGDSEDGRLFGC